jgi:hypothetical protein
MVTDTNFPEETIIFYSKGKKLFQFVIFLIPTAAGFSLIYDSQYFLGAPAFLVGIFFLYKCVKNLLDRKPQIILNKNGIETISTPFYSWEDIQHEEVIRERNGMYTFYYLVYNYPKGQKKLSIKEYDISYEKLMQLLIFYRQ